MGRFGVEFWLWTVGLRLHSLDACDEARCERNICHAMERAIHTFDNGVRVYEDQLLDEQRARYERRNVHEAEEEEIFVDLIRRLPPDGCFVDVGAAIGYYLILAHKLLPAPDDPRR